MFFWLALLAAACGESAVTPTLEPTATPEISPTGPATPTVPEATLAPTPTGVPTTEIDPVRSLPPAITVPIVTSPPELPSTTITPGLYGPLPTPPRTLDPKAAGLGNEAQKPLSKGNFIVGTSAGLYLLNLAGDAEKLIAGNAGFSNPKVAPDGLHIVALRTDWLTKQTQMALVDPTGVIKPLAPDGGGLFLTAAWSPDSKTLALTRVTDTNADGLADANDATSLVLYDVASGKQQNIGEGGFAAWSPDGVRLALILSGPPGTDLDPTTHQLQRSPNAIGVYNFTSKARRTLLESKGLEVTLDSAGFTPIPPDLKLGVRYFKAVTWHPDSQHITASADITGPTGLRAGVIVTLTLDNTTPKVVTAAGDAAGKVIWAGDGKHLAFEILPQFPVGPKSANQVALLESASPQNTGPTKILLGNPATRSETRDPQWVANSQNLAFLESDNSVLTLAGSDGQNLRRLVSGCNGFDWY